MRINEIFNIRQSSGARSTWNGGEKGLQMRASGWRAMAFDYGRTRRALFHPSESTGADYTRASRKLLSVLSRSPNREVDAKIVLHNIRCSPDLLSNELAHNYTTNSDRLENPWHSPHSCNPTTKTCRFDLSSVRAGQELFFLIQDEFAQPKVRIRNQKKTKEKKFSSPFVTQRAPLLSAKCKGRKTQELRLFSGFVFINIKIKPNFASHVQEHLKWWLLIWKLLRFGKWNKKTKAEK